MRKMRKLRRLKIDVTKFLADYNDAVASGMAVSEFCQVTGLHISTLHGRLRTLAKRGVILPMLPGMKKRTKMGRLLGAWEPPAREEQAPIVTPAAVPVVTAAPAATSFQICVGSGI